MNHEPESTPHTGMTEADPLDYLHQHVPLEPADPLHPLELARKNTLLVAPPSRLRSDLVRTVLLEAWSFGHEVGLIDPTGFCAGNHTLRGKSLYWGPMDYTAAEAMRSLRNLVVRRDQSDCRGVRPVTVAIVLDRRPQLTQLAEDLLILRSGKPILVNLMIVAEQMPEHSLVEPCVDRVVRLD